MTPEAEHKTDTRSIVTTLYDRLLGRSPGEIELRFWMNYLESRSFGELYDEFLSCDEFRSRNGVQAAHPPGHFYSPVIDPKIINLENLSRPLTPLDMEILGISIDSMKEFWNTHIGIVSSFNFAEQPNQDYRFYLDNPVYSYADAIMLRAMLLIWRPRRIIEIGSGFSSAVMLDTIDECQLAVDKITLIDPDFERLRALLKPKDYHRLELIEAGVQEINPNIFADMEQNDILFIDSTHVIKTQSDVCFEFFKIIPNLKPGVLIHFHDVFYPFEYPLEWVMQRRYSWNEIYGIRLFLMYNRCFKVIFFNDIFGKLCEDLVRRTCPLYLKNIGGALWLRREPV